MRDMIVEILIRKLWLGTKIFGFTSTSRRDVSNVAGSGEGIN